MDHTSTLTGLHQAIGGDRTPGGLDVVYTKLAVDLQNLPDDGAIDALRRCVDTLRDAVGCDAVCVALLDDTGETLESVYGSRATFSPCNPEVLQGTSLDELPWLRAGLEHLRLQDVSANDR